MPNFTYQPRSINDPSQLSEGWHPAFLLAIHDEETPEQWAMRESSPRMWRWVFAVWSSPETLAQQTPELQSAPTSQKFTPGGRYQPSKAYLWTCTLLGRAVQAGESVSLDEMLPMACRVKIRRVNGQGQPIEFANIVDLEPWTEGTPLLTPELRQKLQTWFAMKQNGTPASTPAPAPAQAARPAPAPAGWGQPPRAPAAAPLDRSPGQAAPAGERKPLAW